MSVSLLIRKVLRHPQQCVVEIIRVNCNFARFVTLVVVEAWRRGEMPLKPQPKHMGHMESCDDRIRRERPDQPMYTENEPNVKGRFVPRKWTERLMGK